MIKYCKIIDNEKGLVQLGAGCSDEYYIEIGMIERDVQQSDKDFQWYLTEKCPMKTDEEKEQEEIERIANLTMTALDLIGYIQKEKGLTLEQINSFLESNLSLKMQLTYCQNVYCKVAYSLCPITINDVVITKEEIIKWFKDKNKEV